MENQQNKMPTTIRVNVKVGHPRTKVESIEHEEPEIPEIISNCVNVLLFPGDTRGQKPLISNRSLAYSSSRLHYRNIQDGLCF
jgi:hypothetical protein